MFKELIALILFSSNFFSSKNNKGLGLVVFIITRSAQTVNNNQLRVFWPSMVHILIKSSQNNAGHELCQTDH